MKEPKSVSIVQQVQRLVTERAYLITTLGTLYAIGRDAPGTCSPAVLDQLKKALDYVGEEVS